MIEARQVDKLGGENVLQHFVGNGERKKQLGRPKRKWNDIGRSNKYSL